MSKRARIEQLEREVADLKNRLHLVEQMEWKRPNTPMQPVPSTYPWVNPQSPPMPITWC